jgi:hypothetical protein
MAVASTVISSNLRRMGMSINLRMAALSLP